MLPEGCDAKVENVLKPGKDMVAAGYCMYGSSCMVCTSNNTDHRWPTHGALMLHHLMLPACCWLSVGWLTCLACPCANSQENGWLAACVQHWGRCQRLHLGPVSGRVHPDASQHPGTCAGALSELCLPDTYVSFSLTCEKSVAWWACVHISLPACSFMQIPKKGKIYSVNEGNAKHWDEPTKS